VNIVVLQKFQNGKKLFFIIVKKLVLLLLEFMKRN